MVAKTVDENYDIRRNSCGAQLYERLDNQGGMPQECVWVGQEGLYINLEQGS